MKVTTPRVQANILALVAEMNGYFEKWNLEFDGDYIIAVANEGEHTDSVIRSLYAGLLAIPGCELQPKFPDLV